MTDTLLFQLYDVTEGPCGWMVQRFGDLEHSGAPAVLVSGVSEAAAHEPVSADIASGGWRQGQPTRQPVTLDYERLPSGAVEFFDCETGNPLWTLPAPLAFAAPLVRRIARHFAREG